MMITVAALVQGWLGTSVEQGGQNKQLSTSLEGQVLPKTALT